LSKSARDPSREEGAASAGLNAAQAERDGVAAADLITNRHRVALMATAKAFTAASIAATSITTCISQPSHAFSFSKGKHRKDEASYVLKKIFSVI
jgi:hypothetical protein